MHGQMTEYEIVQSTEVSTPTDEELDTYCWRMEQLLQAGYSHLLADALAPDREVDLHIACDLLARGCSQQTAYLIMA
jgi:hypothetical protein